MKLTQIQYFVAVADNNNITKAAEKLFVSQPALSKQMTLLEDELGVKLFERRSNGVKLTENGIEFAKDCRDVLDRLDKAVQKVSNSGKTEKNVLRIGCFDGAVVDDFLPGLYSDLREHNPELEIKIGRHTMPENRRSLEADEIDLMIELRFPFEKTEYDKKGYCVKTLVTRQGALIYSRQSPLAKKKDLKPSDFEKEPYLMVKDASMMSRPAMNSLKRIGIEHPRIEETDNFMTLLSNLKLGQGYCVLAKLVADTSPDLLAYPLPEDRRVEVIAVWKKENRFVGSLLGR